MREALGSILRSFGLPNRVVVLVTFLAGLGAALAVPLAHLDTHSTAAALTGLAAVFGVADRYLRGWQSYEAKAFHAPTDGDDRVHERTDGDPHAKGGGEITDAELEHEG
jgi:hypothetical protein